MLRNKRMQKVILLTSLNSFKAWHVLSPSESSHRLVLQSGTSFFSYLFHESSHNQGLSLDSSVSRKLCLGPCHEAGVRWCVVWVFYASQNVALLYHYRVTLAETVSSRKGRNHVCLIDQTDHCTISTQYSAWPRAGAQ